MKIIIETIPHDQKRAGGGWPGDWYFDDQGDLHVEIADLGDWRYNFLLARHEMDEAMLCKFYGITTGMVDEYDTRPESVSDEPDSFSGYPGAIFQAQHNDALASEWQMSRLLGVDWVKYGDAFTPFWDDREITK